MPNLVGIGNSQVPTNAMLGGLAYQDSVGEVLINKIKAKTGDTAVDVFVYDTRKDSDGGAWRHRTQNKSWYGEGVSATRGARKEFPVVAILVLQSLKLTIYDGDDPNLPMWMVVTGANNNYAIETQATCTAALNGVICIGCGGSGHDFYQVNFLLDAAFEMSTGGDFRFIDNIGTRSSHNRGGLDGGRRLNSRKINDVAMTVLPNAPIDDVTGLPVPTIAVATDVGISIINNDGTTVTDMRPTGSSVPQAKEIYFTKSNKIAFTHGANWVYYYPIPFSDTTSTYWNGLADFIGRFTDTQRNWDANGIPINVGSNGITNFIEDRAIGHTNGVDLIHINEGDPVGSGMHCGIATNFNTGWMVGDIKGAFLSDTDDTNLTDTNLVTNGDFSNGSTGWSLHGLTVDTSGNTMVMTSSNGNQRISQAITVEEGQTYFFSVGGSGGNRATYISKNTVSNQSLTNRNNSHFTVPAGYTTVYVVLYVIGTGNSTTFDDIIVTKADPDRSINNKATNNNGKGLQVLGTITKTAVATGAELVAYSGFTTTNHLEDNFNHLFGTGDLCFIFWFKLTAAGNNNQTFIDMSSSNGGVGDPRLRIHQMSSPSGSVRFYTTNGNVVSTSNRINAGWTCVAAVRRNSNLELYINGELEGSGSTSNSNFSTAAGQLSIGLDGDNSDPLDNGSITLLRSTATAPSPEQIKKIYNDEKCLFDKNAKCTLHGSSNAVVALAHDDTGDVIHAGTSSGRSDFRGLNRINNTTTAVTTVISASNELVAEQ